MKIIRKAPNPSGGYPSPQDWPDGVMIPEEMAVWPDTLDTADFFSHNGFAVLTIEQVEGVDTVDVYKRQDQGSTPNIIIQVSDNTFGAGMDEAAVAEAIADIAVRKVMAGYRG